MRPLIFLRTEALPPGKKMLNVGFYNLWEAGKNLHFYPAIRSRVVQPRPSERDDVHVLLPPIFGNQLAVARAETLRMDYEDNADDQLWSSHNRYHLGFRRDLDSPLGSRPGWRCKIFLLTSTGTVDTRCRLIWFTVTSVLHASWEIWLWQAWYGFAAGIVNGKVVLAFVDVDKSNLECQAFIEKEGRDLYSQKEQDTENTT